MQSKEKPIFGNGRDLQDSFASLITNFKCLYSTKKISLRIIETSGRYLLEVSYDGDIEAYYKIEVHNYGSRNNPGPYTLKIYVLVDEINAS